MGKDSLIKSTTKKKSTADKDEKLKKDQKVSAKTKKSTKSKTTAKPKKKAATTKKTTTKKKPAVKAKKTTTAPKKKKAAKAKAPTASKIPSQPKPQEPEKVKEEQVTLEPPTSTGQAPPPPVDPGDPTEKMMQYGIGGFVVLVLLVVIASWMNTQNYYVKSSNGAIDIWQGKFAPKGMKHIMNIPGIQPPATAKDTYSQNDVFPLICQYYVDKADTLLDVPGMPDFDGVKDYLNRSKQYAVSADMKSLVKSRLDALDLMVLLYKAEVSASKNTIEDLETAKGLLKKALGYPMDTLEETRIEQKAEAVTAKLKKLKSAAKTEKKAKSKK